jgi:lysophospholipase L1-like esterase
MLSGNVMKKFLCILIILTTCSSVASATTIEGDSLTVGTKPYSTCKTNAWVGRPSHQVKIRPKTIITTGANDGIANMKLLREAKTSGAQWATIWMPGRQEQSNAFNRKLRSVSLGYPDWASYAKTLPSKAWAKDGVHHTVYGYKLRAAFFNQYC